MNECWGGGSKMRIFEKWGHGLVGPPVPGPVPNYIWHRTSEKFPVSLAVLVYPSYNVIQRKQTWISMYVSTASPLYVMDTTSNISTFRPELTVFWKSPFHRHLMRLAASHTS